MTLNGKSILAEDYIPEDVINWETDQISELQIATVLYSKDKWVSSREWGKSNSITVSDSTRQCSICSTVYTVCGRIHGHQERLHGLHVLTDGSDKLSWTPGQGFNHDYYPTLSPENPIPKFLQFATEFSLPQLYLIYSRKLDLRVFNRFVLNPVSLEFWAKLNNIRRITSKDNYSTALNEMAELYHH